MIAAIARGRGTSLRIIAGRIGDPLFSPVSPAPRLVADNRIGDRPPGGPVRGARRVRGGLRPSHVQS